jgi:hypothetical protein
MLAQIQLVLLSSQAARLKEKGMMRKAFPAHNENR